MAVILFLFPFYAKVKHKSNKYPSPTAMQMQLYNNNCDNAELMAQTNNNNIVTGSMKHFLLYTIVGTILHTGGGFLYYLSFTGITVPTAISLGRLRAIWVYILAVIFLKETASLWKCLAVLTSFVGIFCYVFEVSHSSDNQTNDTLWGCVVHL